MGKCRKEAEGSWNIRQLKITTHHSDCSSEVAGPKSSFFESSATKKFTVVYCIIDDSTLGRIRFCALILYFVKKKDFSHISEKYSLFLANNIVIAINYWNFSNKIVVFVKIKNKRTKPDTSLIVSSVYSFVELLWYMRFFCSITHIYGGLTVSRRQALALSMVHPAHWRACRREMSLLKM